MPGGAGQIQHDLLEPFGGIGLLIHDDAAKGQHVRILRLAEDVQKQLFFFVEVVADHLFQGEEPLEGKVIFGDLPDKIALGGLGGDDQIASATSSP